MRDDAPKRATPDVGALQPAMREADDQKIRRILAVVDNAADPAVNQVLLESLRPRLATLRPVRPLRFARLLFLPLDPLTVPADEWRSGDPAIPRSILGPVASIVRSGLGEETGPIDLLIEGQKSDATQVITRAGEMLWPRAEDIISAAPLPADWPETGLSPSDWAPLAAGIAAVLRRASLLRCLANDEEIGALAPDADIAAGIPRHISEESAMGRAMIARLMLLRSPRAAQSMRRDLGPGQSPADKAAMRQAMDLGLDAVLSHMERKTGFDEIGGATLAEVGGEVRRVTMLLRGIEAETASAAQWPRAKAIRAKLDEVCRDRFARGVKEGLVMPLAAASGPVEGEQQTGLESCARDLRKLDIAARKPGGVPGFDIMLRQAAEAVRLASETGALTRMRYYRLIEILMGPDAAEALYEKGALPA